MATSTAEKGLARVMNYPQDARPFPLAMASPEYKVFRGTNLVGVFDALELTDAYQQGRVLDDDVFVTEETDRPLPIHALEIEKTPSSPIMRMQSALWRIGTTFMGLLWVGGIICLFIGGAKSAEILEPWINGINLVGTVVVLLSVPVALILLIPAGTRVYAGYILFVAALPVGLWVWIVSLLYAISISRFWTIIGVILGGIGIVPTAIVIAAVRRDWGAVLVFAVGAIIWIALRSASAAIIGRQLEKESVNSLR